MKNERREGVSIDSPAPTAYLPRSLAEFNPCPLMIFSR